MHPNAKSSIPSKPIVFFDGVCGLCNRFVDFLLDHDTNHQFLFSPLKDSEIAQTILLKDGNKTYRHSSAIVRILYHLGGAWRILAVAVWVVPKPIRDVIYRWIAKHRYGWFGKKESCRTPNPEERSRFLNSP